MVPFDSGPISLHCDTNNAISLERSFELFHWLISVSASLLNLYTMTITAVKATTSSCRKKLV